jgi:hypothetical protein
MNPEIIDRAVSFDAMKIMHPQESDEVLNQSLVTIKAIATNQANSGMMNVAFNSAEFLAIMDTIPPEDIEVVRNSINPSVEMANLFTRLGKYQELCDVIKPYIQMMQVNEAPFFIERDEVVHQP